MCLWFAVCETAKRSSWTDVLALTCHYLIRQMCVRYTSEWRAAAAWTHVPVVNVKTVVVVGVSCPAFYLAFCLFG